MMMSKSATLPGTGRGGYARFDDVFGISKYTRWGNTGLIGMDAKPIRSGTMELGQSKTLRLGGRSICILFRVLG
jgi:hypothetical protein